MSKEAVHKMFRLSILPALAVCAAGLVAPSVAKAQAKVAVIDFQRAILETAEIKKASNELQGKYKPRTDALDKVQKELNDIQTQRQSSQSRLSAAGETDLTPRGQRKTREAHRFSEELRADAHPGGDDILSRARTPM